MMEDENYDPMVACPFNDKHILHKSRLQRHILRCMKNYPHFEVCWYNAMHRFATKDLMIQHMLGCPDRHKFQTTYNYNPKPAVKPPAKIDTTAFNLEFGSWEDEYRS